MRLKVKGYEWFYEVDENGNFYNANTGRLKKETINHV